MSNSYSSSSHFIDNMCYYYNNTDGTLVFSHRSFSQPGNWHSSSYSSHSEPSSNLGDCGFTDHIQGCKPQINASSGQASAIVAALWSDIDLRLGNGRLYIHERNDPATLGRVFDDIYDGTGNLFYPENSVVATWENVQQFGTCNGLVSLQISCLKCLNSPLNKIVLTLRLKDIYQVIYLL